MRLEELFEQIQHNEVTRRAIKKVTDFLAFLKIRDIKTVKTDQLLKSLEKNGIFIDFDELVKIADDFDVIEDINAEIVTLQKDDSIKSHVKKDQGEIDKERLSKNAVDVAQKGIKKKFK